MEDEAVLDRGASFLKHVCDEEEVEGKGPWTAYDFTCKMGMVGKQRKRAPLFCRVIKIETSVSLIGVKLTC